MVGGVVTLTIDGIPGGYRHPCICVLRGRGCCRLLQLRRHHFLRRTSVNILAVGSRLSCSHCSRHCGWLRHWLHAGGSPRVGGGQGIRMVRDTSWGKRQRGAVVPQRWCINRCRCIRVTLRCGMRLGLRGTAVGKLQRDQTVPSGQFSGGAGVTSIGQHCHFVSLTGSSGRSCVGPILALNASNMTLGCGRSRCGQLVVIFHEFSGFDNERNQRARREAHAGAKSSRCGMWEIVAIGFADDCIVGVNRIGASSMA